MNKQIIDDIIFNFDHKEEPISFWADKVYKVV